MTVVIIILVAIIALLGFVIFGVATVALRWKDKAESLEADYIENLNDLKRLFLNEKLKNP